jgi:hypothetical protein
VAIHDPNYDLRRRLKAIEEQLRRQRNTSPLAGTGLSVVDSGQLMQDGSVTIPNNGLLLVDGGDVVMLDQAPAATEIFRLGVQQYGDRGITIRRNDGTVAIEVKNSFSATDPRQSFIIRDPSGAAIGGDSVLANSGFDAPHIELRFIPVDYTSNATAQTTSATTFTALHEYRGFRQNPGLKPQLMVKCSDGTTSAQIQFYDVNAAGYLGGFNGSPVVHTITAPTGTTVFTLFELPSAIVLPGSMSDAMHLEIHAKVTAGTGSVSVAPVRTIGTGL